MNDESKARVEAYREKLRLNAETIDSMFDDLYLPVPMDPDDRATVAILGIAEGLQEIVVELRELTSVLRMRD